MAFDLKAALDKAMELLAERLGKNLYQRDNLASGNLSSDMRTYTKNPRVGIWTGELLMLDYWEAVDKGRKAGTMPPVQSIIDWLQYPNVKDKLTGNREDLFDEGATESIAYAIARNIGKFGTRGSDFASDAVVYLIENVDKEVSKAIGLDLELMIDDIQKIVDE
jgi:hypothetical protein